LGSLHHRNTHALNEHRYTEYGDTTESFGNVLRAGGEADKARKLKEWERAL
jgi:hypothetical protein